MKKILVFEPLVGGHFTNYIEALCEHADMAPELRSQNIVFVIDKRMLEDERIRRFRETLEFDTEISTHLHSPAFDLRSLKSYYVGLRKLWEDYALALERHLPERAIIPTADHLSQAALISRPTKVRPHTTAILHQSRAASVNAKSYVKRFGYECVWALSPWDRILLVNPQSYYERIYPNKNKLRYGLSPDPVAKVDLIDRHEARRRLGLDVRLDYIGVVGNLGIRLDLTAIFEAFKAGNFTTETRLLLAGAPSHRAQRELIEKEIRDPKIGRKIIFLDRHLRKSELHTYYRACNVVMPYYSDTTGFSANLLLAVSANVPALVASHGFGQWLVRRFPHVGATASSSPVIMAQTLNNLIIMSKTRRPPPDDVRRLLDFYSSYNFSREAFGMGALPSPYIDPR